VDTIIIYNRKFRNDFIAHKNKINISNCSLLLVMKNDENRLHLIDEMLECQPLELNKQMAHGTFHAKLNRNYYFPLGVK